MFELLFYLMVVGSLVIFIKKGDEFPALITLFFWAAGLNRYQLLDKGAVNYTVVNYTNNFFIFNDQLANDALFMIFLGSVVFWVSYVLISSKKESDTGTKDTPSLFRQFILKETKLIIILFLVFFPLNIAANTLLRSLPNIAFGASYFFLFRLAIGGLILLAFLAWRNMEWQQYGIKKHLFLALIIYSAIDSYNPGLRFQFLSWMIAFGFLIIRDLSPSRKVVLYVLGGGAGILLFSFAGVMRGGKMAGDFTFQDKFNLALERTVKQEDVNFLDGMMMSLQVYPERLPFRYGVEHLEILMRPIPRQLWPDKPTGSYLHRLGLMDGFTGSVGISPTIYGSFYAEGGTTGIIIFAVLYGWLVAKLLTLARGFQSDMRYLIKGLVFASMIALLRGGDLPGIFAFIGMSYWPVFLMMWRYSKYRKRLPSSSKPAMAPA